jgi:hypothetical protein
MARSETLKRIDSRRGTQQQHQDEVLSDDLFYVNKTSILNTGDSMQKQLIENKLTKTPTSEKGRESHRIVDSDNDDLRSIEQIFENNVMAYVNG